MTCRKETTSGEQPREAIPFAVSRVARARGAAGPKRETVRAVWQRDQQTDYLTRVSW